MEQPLCIVWDCDGTLLDTEETSSDIIAGIMEKVKPGSRAIEKWEEGSIRNHLGSTIVPLLECPLNCG